MEAASRLPCPGSSSPTSGAGSRKAKTPLGGSGIKPVNLSKSLDEPPIVGQCRVQTCYHHWEMNMAVWIRLRWQIQIPWMLGKGSHKT